MSKLSDFLKKNKIDARRILIASDQIESHQPEDRAIRLAKRDAKAPEASDEVKELAGKKPRSGRPVAGPTLRAALEGKPLTGPQKTRITRAINKVLVVKKKGEVTLRELF